MKTTHDFNINILVSLDLLVKKQIVIFDKILCTLARTVIRLTGMNVDNFFFFWNRLDLEMP